MLIKKIKKDCVTLTNNKLFINGGLITIKYDGKGIYYTYNPSGLPGHKIKAWIGENLKFLETLITKD